jgi:tetratricopeptide (TPR) repeat protein
MQTYTIFVSSPGDVDDERRRAERAIRKLQTEFDGYICLEPIFWEHQPQSAQRHFQEQIKKLPRDTDLVVCILWSRLGTRLPEDKFLRSDGTPYRSGTEFEFEDAISGYQKTGKTPELWVYRKTADVLVSLSDPRKAEMERQKGLLDDFLAYWLGSTDNHFKRGFNTFTDADEFERQFEDHLRTTLLERCPKYRKDSDELPTWPPGKPPYRGLDYFDLEHAPVFHGRVAAVHAVLEQLQAQAAMGRPFVLVLGASGVGKSSLLRAGLLHALVNKHRVKEVDLWRYAVFEPNAKPGDLMRGLAADLLAETALPELAQAKFGDIEALAKQLACHPEGLAGSLDMALEAAADRLRRESGWSFAPVARLVLVVDPLEEIFLPDRVDAKTRNELLAALRALAASGRVWILAGMRYEFYHQAAEHPVLVALKAGAGQYDLLPPDETELGEIIRYPARTVGMDFELRDGRRLDALLLESAAYDPNALPLLEFTLDELYRRARERGDTVLSYADYEALGGLDGAIKEAAENAVKEMGAADLATVRDVLRQMVRLDDGKCLKRRVPLEWFRDDSAQWEAVSKLINVRLLTSNKTGDSQTAMVEPVHETLLRSWQRLARWIEEDAEVLTLRARMEKRANDWREARNSMGYLLSSEKEEQDAKLLLEKPWVKMDTDMRKFLDLSLRRIRRRRVVFRWTAGRIVGVFLVMAGGFGYFNYLERKKAETAAGLALDAVNRVTYELPTKLQSIAGTSKILDETFQQNADLLKHIDELRGETWQTKGAIAVNILRRGTQQETLGNLADALLSYRQANTLLKQLLILMPADSMFLDNARQHLSKSYEDIGNALKQQGDLGGALKNYEAGLEIDKQLAEKQPDNPTFQRLLSSDHIDIGKVLTKQGKHIEALARFRVGCEIAEKLVARDAKNQGWQEHRANCLDDVGDTFDSLGRSPEALSSYRAAFGIRERLLKEEPTNAIWQKGLSVSHNKIGDILRDQGDFKGALENYQIGLAIRQKLVNQEEINADWQRDIAVNFEKIGKVLELQGDVVGALKNYRASLAIIEKLSMQDPTNRELQRELSLFHERIGDALMAIGDWSGALESFRLDLAIVENLASKQPANLDWQYDLGISHERVGDVLAAQGDLDGAKREYQVRHRISTRLVEQNPPNSDWLYDLSVSHDKLGGVLGAHGDSAGATVNFQASLDIRSKLAAQDPTKAEWQYGLAVCHINLGLLARQIRKTTEALAEFRAALAILEPLVAKTPDHAQ